MTEDWSGRPGTRSGSAWDGPPCHCTTGRQEVSTEEQRERSTIETQRDFAERYCALHHLTAFRVYAVNVFR